MIKGELSCAWQDSSLFCFSSRFHTVLPHILRKRQGSAPIGAIRHAAYRAVGYVRRAPLLQARCKMPIDRIGDLMLTACGDMQAV